MKLLFYGIRHKKTRELMPQAKKDRGYSHWNPNNKDKEFEQSLGIPRLLQSRGQAHKCIIQWAAMPNARMTARTYYGYNGEESEPDIDIKDDGRSKDDLEVVEIILETKR